MPSTRSVPPFVEEMAVIDDYRDAAAVLRDPTVRTIWSSVGAGGRDLTFVRDGLIVLDGREHLERRHLESPLFTSARLLAYERDGLDPQLDGFLEEARRGVDVDGEIQLDLVEFALSMLVRIGASMTGVDAVDTPERAGRLLELHDTVSEATNIHWAKCGNAERQAVLDRGRAAQEAFVEEFLGPSLARRTALLRQVDNGALAAGDLPRDLITALLASLPDSGRAGVIAREVLIYLQASIRTSTRVLCNAVEELFGWLGQHPGDRARLDDEQFLRDVVEETLRLRAVLPVILRRTTEPLTLPSGRVLPAEQHVAILHGAANREPGLFGDDAHEFRPGRALDRPGVHPYGLAFGLGPHVCIGKRVAIGGPTSRDGSDPTVGTVPAILRHLLRAGLQPDPDRPPVPNATSYYDEFTSFPVRLTDV